MDRLQKESKRLYREYLKMVAELLQETTETVEK